MKDLIYRAAREALSNGDLTAEEIRQTVEEAVESHEQEADDDDGLGDALLTKDEGELILLALSELHDGLQYNDEEDDGEREAKYAALGALKTKIGEMHR